MRKDFIDGGTVVVYLRPSFSTVVSDYLQDRVRKSFCCGDNKAIRYGIGDLGTEDGGTQKGPNETYGHDWIIAEKQG